MTHDHQTGPTPATGPDIVERLRMCRHPETNGPLCQEAATEIATLRRQNADLANRLGNLEGDNAGLRRCITEAAQWLNRSPEPTP
jgi:hypothetical protein